jgi:hypothetical protein
VRRTILGVLVSGAVLPIAVAGYSMFKGWGLEESVAIAAVYAAFTYSGTLALGLPTHALLRRFNLRSVWYYAAAGALLGLLVLVVLFLMNSNVAVGMITVLVFMTFGAVTAAVFWRLAARPEDS